MTDVTTATAAVELLRSLGDHGVEYLFANLGTDHTPLLEGLARLRTDGRADEAPTLLTCPHEFVAMSAAHGYAAATGRPQAVLVHVDVGTQNLGAAMHNAHRTDAPVFVVAGTAPITRQGNPGSRDHPIHYMQDIFDQHSIVEEYCRWTGSYRPPEHPEPLVARGLTRATAPPAGPVYLTAGREALEYEPGEHETVPTRGPALAEPGAAQLDQIAAAVRSADRPLVIASKIGLRTGGLESLRSFAEAAGAGVIEQRPVALCLPRDHPLHVGFDPTTVLDEADLVLAVDTDVPWLPNETTPDPDAETIQIDPAPSKPTYPRWEFEFDRAFAADPVATLERLADRLDGGEDGSRWRRLARQRRELAAERADEHRDADRLTPVTLTSVLDDLLEPEDVVVEDAVTSRGAVLSQLDRTLDGSYYANGAAGLGWGGGAAVGVKLGRPKSRVVSLLGDGAYLFAHPSSTAAFGVDADAPTLTVIYDNRGWNAVRSATVRQHPDGIAARDGVPGSRFESSLDLSAPAGVVDAYTAMARDRRDAREALRKGLEAIEEGRPAVVDVKLEPL